ncbi:MAG: hypothetical protein PUE01_12010, partial [Clostridiaceae bacterium]|nr:hypothetical protein [Clostridiaceae bacterium]
MIKENQKLVNKFTIVIDVLVIIASFLITWYIRMESGVITLEGGTLSFEEYFIPFLVMVPVYLIIYNYKRLYDNGRMVFISKLITNTIVANVYGIVIFLGVLFVTKRTHYSRSLLIIFFIVCTVLTCIERVAIRLSLRGFRKKGYNVRYTVFVGFSDGTKKFNKLINDNKHWGLKVIGIFEDSEVNYDGIQYLGKIED